MYVLSSSCSLFYLLQEQNVEEAWNKTSWARKLANKKTRAGLSDFSRFKVMVAKKQKSKIIADKVVELTA